MCCLQMEHLRIQTRLQVLSADGAFTNTNPLAGAVGRWSVYEYKPTRRCRRQMERLRIQTHLQVSSADGAFTNTNPLAGAVGRLWHSFAGCVSLRTHRQLRDGGVGVDRREHRLVLLSALRLPLHLCRSARPGTRRL